MFKLFTEYATQQLNISKGEDQMNETTDADVTAYVVNLLNLSFVSESGSIDENMEKENLSTKTSRTDKIVQKLRTMPDSSVNYYHTTMRVEPNTPFKPVYQLSTIVNHPNGAIKRENPDKDSGPRAMKLSRISGVKQEKPEASNKFIEYEVEALDECSFMQGLQLKKSWGNSTGSKDFSQESTGPVYVSNASNHFSVVELSDDSGNSGKLPITKKPFKRFPKGITLTKIPQNCTVNLTSTTNKSMDLSISQKQRPKISTLISPLNYSVLDVPQLDESFDGFRAAKQSPVRAVLPVTANQSISFNRRSTIIPKKLSYGLSVPEVKNVPVDPSPPAWFQKFKKCYDLDVKRVDAKLEIIEQKLNRILETQQVLPRTVLKSPRVVQIKRGES